MMRSIQVVILAGGSGERLWPLSSAQHPKQCIPFINGYSLLEKTIERIALLRKKVSLTLSIVTSAAQHELIQGLVGDTVDTFYVEPCGNNTAPAVLLANTAIMQQNPEAIVVYLPADHFIPDAEQFAQTLYAALEYASEYDRLVLLGIRPTHPATGYGYIEVENDDRTDCKKIKKFHEKPQLEVAQDYVAQGTMFWNLGIFIGKAAVMQQEYQLCAPALYAAYQAYRAGMLAYSALPSVAIDYAVIEKSHNLVLLQALFAWYDVGNVRTFLELQQRYDRATEQVLTVSGSGNIAHTSKQVVCVGVSDLCIVESGNSLLIVHRSALEEVKKAALLVAKK